MMDVLYILAIWAHITAMAFWFGSMFFADPESTRFFSKLLERTHGVGWYAHGVLWPTGIFLLYYRGVLGRLFSADFIATDWGKTLWLKILLVLVLVVFQITVGHKPSKLVYGYILVTFFIIGISTVLVRPVIF